jgi:hypothetical protein
MSAQPIIREGRIAVNRALADLGLRPEYVRDAVLAGESARDSCTANDPRNAPGFFAWARCVRALREILAPLGWIRDDEDALETAINPDGSIAIDVVTGNDETGIPEPTAMPNTKYPKGPATGRAINSNRDTLFEALEWEEGAIERSNAAKRQTWILLRKRVSDDLLRAELSLPESMTEQGFVERWSIRIILDIDIGPALARQSSGPSEPIIDVPVRRRSER